jgi:hypothetical protein
VPGVAEYEQQGNQLIPKLPTPDMCAGGGGISAGGLLTVLGAAAGVATIGYFLLK